MRAEIEEQFGAKVFDYYGSREVGAIAGECAHGSRHVFVMNNLVEVLDDDDRPVNPGTEGKLVITCLHNYSFPMIRYEIGDVGTMASQPCKCSSRLPYLNSLSGRITDHFVQKSGKLVHGEFVTHLFYFRDWVDQFQVDQLEFDRLRIRVVRRGEVVEDDVSEINQNLRLVMGSDCKVDWEYVESIDKSAQGKFVFTRCLIPEQALNWSSSLTESSEKLVAADTGGGAIALFTGSMRGGGAERMMLTLASEFAERGVGVDLVLVKAEGRVPGHGAGRRSRG